MTKSFDYQEYAKTRIPGITQLLSKRPDMFSYGVWPGYYTKAKGVQVWDLDGVEYTDMSIAGIGANVLGYADDDVDEAVIKAIRNGVSSSLNCPEEVELADLFCELHPWAEMVRYTRSGGEAAAMAVRIARAKTGRSKVAFCGYHGWHDWYLSANIRDEGALDGHLLAGLEPTGVPKELSGTSIPFMFNDCDALKKLALEEGNNIAIIVMEPIRNSAPTKEFIETLNWVRNTYGIILLVDEISAGLRLCTGGAHLTVGLEPDMATFSKALGNGYAMSAVIGKKFVMEAAQLSFISSTNWTERVGPTAAIATLQKHRKYNVAEHLIRIGTRVQDGWKAAAQNAGLEISISGMAPMGHFGFSVENPLAAKAYYVQLMLEKGYLASNLFYAMYAHTDAHVDGYLAATETSFKLIAEATSDGTLEKRLKGKPSQAGFKRLN